MPARPVVDNDDFEFALLGGVDHREQGGRGQAPVPVGRDQYRDATRGAFWNAHRQFVPIDEMSSQYRILPAV